MNLIKAKGKDLNFTKQVKGGQQTLLIICIIRINSSTSGA